MDESSNTGVTSLMSPDQRNLAQSAAVMFSQNQDMADIYRGIMEVVRQAGTRMNGLAKGGPPMPTDQMELLFDILDLLPAARSLKKAKKGIETLSKKRKPSQQLEKIAPNKKMREALEAKRKKQSKQVDETMAKALENSKKPKKKTKSKVKIDRSEPKRFDSDENPKDRALRERLNRKR